MAKLSFNGYHVTFFNHEGRTINEQNFPTYESVVERGFTKDGSAFPDARTFAEDLFNVYGDFVGMIKDNAGYILLDKMQEMLDLEREVSGG